MQYPYILISKGWTRTLRWVEDVLPASQTLGQCTVGWMKTKGDSTEP